VPPRYRRRTLLALAGATAVVACTPSPPAAESPSQPPPEPTASPTPRGAPLTGTLAVYSALDEPITTALLGAFTKTFPGVRAEAIAYAPPDELETRLRIELRSRKADVLLGGASAHHDILGKDGFLEVYLSAPAAQISAPLRELTGLWTGWYEDVLGLVVNTDRVAKEFRGKPTTWDDLLDPAWKGKLVIPDPALTDAGFAFLATQYFRFDREEAKTLDYLKALHPNVLQYPRDAGAAVTMVARDEVAGAAAWGHDVLADGARTPGTAMLAPKDASLEIGAVSIVKGTQSGAAARALVDWLVSRDAQTLVATAGGRSPARALAAPPAGSPPLSGIDPARYDRRAAYDIRGRLLARWRTAAGL
jgi:iron(III) transport system substrate-binding protein